MSKIKWIPANVNIEDVKADLGFTNKDITFSRQPVIEAKAFEGDNGGYSRITTPTHVFMTSVAALKAAQMPIDPAEGTVDISCQKGKLKVYLNK